MNSFINKVYTVEDISEEGVMFFGDKNFYFPVQSLEKVEDDICPNCNGKLDLLSKEEQAGHMMLCQTVTNPVLHLTKREYFAAMAMQGLLSCNPSFNYIDVAIDSVRLADALIAELNKGEGV